MQTNTEVLYINGNSSIHYNTTLNRVDYLRKYSKIVSIALSSPLLTVQYYPDTGDLLVSSSVEAIVYHSRYRAIFHIETRHEGKITIVNSEYVFANDVSSPRLWILDRGRLTPLVLEKNFIGQEYLAKNRFSVSRTKNGGTLLVTSERKVLIVEPKMILLTRPHHGVKRPEVVPVVTYPELKLEARDENGSYLVKYSKTDSYFAIYLTKSGEEKLLEKVDKHACPLSRILFMRDNFFMSLDNGGKFKIWKLDEFTPCICQTITPDEFHEGAYYSDFELTTKHLILKTNNCADFYNMDLARYKKNTKNHLISYDHSEKLIAVQATTTNHAHQETISKPDVPRKLGSGGRQDSRTCKGEYYGSSYLKHGAKESSLGEAMSIQPGLLSEQSALDSFDIPNNTILDCSSNNAEGRDVSPETTKGPSFTTPYKPASKFRRQRAIIYVGIDFGTSRTKVSFNNESEGRFEPLRFDYLQPQSYRTTDLIDNYAIPSIVRNHQGELFYGYNALSGQGDVYTYFKQKLINESMPDKFTMKISIGYLAYVMKLAKEQIIHLTSASSDDSFVFSVCLPVERMNKNPIAKRFSKIVEQAKVVMLNDSYQWLRDIDGSSSQLGTGGHSIDNIRTAIIPESIAEVLNFCNQKADNKLYALYDFGAGTTDLTIFYYNKTKGQAEVIEAQVINRGYSYIDKLKKDHKVSDEIVRHYYNEIWKELKDHDTWARVKRKIRGLESMRYFYDITLLGSGGGFNDKNVRDVFCRVPLYHERTNEFIIAKSGVIKLQEPADWNSTKPPYFRYAVSFGLTKKPEETNQNYILPRDCPIRDDSVEIKPCSDADVLYPNSSWLRRR